eukprot:PITA_18975
MVVKLDLESAFDRVRHMFLLDVMHKFGFSPKFINWIKACIKEPWIAPLVNGRAAEFFKASRGLRQGCPLSPLLFVIQASVLSFLLNKKQEDQEIMGINIARGVKSINHALFADDTLLLGAASLPSAKNFKEVLDDFCEDSVSNLNKGKCHIYCWNIKARTIQAISNCFGFAASCAWSSFKYLGLPIFQKRALSKDWLPLLDKIKSKIRSWGYNWLNLAGKTVLIKFVLNSLPIYQSAVMMAPLGITRKIEEYIRNFFWKGGKANEKRIPLINWDTISLPRMEGGLQFKNINNQNIALGAKLLWRIIATKPGWAQLVLWKKYFCGQRTRCLDNPLTISGTMIQKLCDRALDLIKQHLHWIPGNGKRIKIWEDNIMGNVPIVEDCSLSLLKDWMDSAGVKTMWDLSQWENNSWIVWETSWTGKASTIKTQPGGIRWAFNSLTKLGPPPPLNQWKIRLNTEDLDELCKIKARKTLFFDGAAKGNPGNSGAGGVIKNADGRIESRYAWGVGFNSSIQAEALALLQGLKMLTYLDIKDAIIFGDSQTIIKLMVDKTTPSDVRLARLISRIRILINTFQNLEFLHVKRENNKEADAEANKAVLLPPGTLLRDGEESWDFIP